VDTSLFATSLERKHQDDFDAFEEAMEMLIDKLSWNADIGSYVTQIGFLCTFMWNAGLMFFRTVEYLKASQTWRERINWTQFVDTTYYMHQTYLYLLEFMKGMSYFCFQNINYKYDVDSRLR
jgi:hypothetical protein